MKNRLLFAVSSCPLTVVMLTQNLTPHRLILVQIQRSTLTLLRLVDPTAGLLVTDNCCQIPVGVRFLVTDNCCHFVRFLTLGCFAGLTPLVHFRWRAILGTDSCCQIPLVGVRFLVTDNCCHIPFVWRPIIDVGLFPGLFRGYVTSR
jgi:hypothetical protein